MKTGVRMLKLGIAAIAVAAMSTGAFAADKVGAIDSTKGPYDHYSLHLAKAKGLFEKEDLDVSVIYGSGGAATLQALITGSRDIAVGVGVLSVIGAYAKGAPVKILGNVYRGAGNIVWYVPKDSPIKSFADLDGKELVYSRPGSTTHLATQFLQKELGFDAKLVSVGGMAASRTQVMSGQVATGWLAAPFNMDLIRKGEARIIGTGTQSKELDSMTIRVVAANSEWLEKNRDVAKRFIKALNAGRDMLYTDEGIEHYAERWKLDMQDAKRGPEFAPKEVTEINEIFGFEKLVKLAHELDYLKEPLPMDKAKGMLDIVGKAGM